MKTTVGPAEGTGQAHLPVKGNRLTTIIADSPRFLPTAEAMRFVDSLTRDEARSMLMYLLGRDPDGWAAAMGEIQRRRAAGRAEGVTR